MIFSFSLLSIFHDRYAISYCMVDCQIPADGQNASIRQKPIYCRWLPRQRLLPFRHCRHFSWLAGRHLRQLIIAWPLRSDWISERPTATPLPPLNIRRQLAELPAIQRPITSYWVIFAAIRQMTLPLSFDIDATPLILLSCRHYAITPRQRLRTLLRHWLALAPLLIRHYSLLMPLLPCRYWYLLLRSPLIAIDSHCRHYAITLIRQLFMPFRCQPCHSRHDTRLFDAISFFHYFPLSFSALRRRHFRHYSSAARIARHFDASRRHCQISWISLLDAMLTPLFCRFHLFILSHSYWLRHYAISSISRHLQILELM